MNSCLKFTGSWKKREKKCFRSWNERWRRGSLFKYATKTVYSSEFSLSAARPIIYSYMCLLRIDFTQHKLTVRMSKQHCNANFQFHSWQKWASERVSEQNKTKQDKEEKNHVSWFSWQIMHGGTKCIRIRKNNWKMAWFFFVPQITLMLVRNLQFRWVNKLYICHWAVCLASKSKQSVVISHLN